MTLVMQRLKARACYLDVWQIGKADFFSWVLLPLGKERLEVSDLTNQPEIEFDEKRQARCLPTNN
jgi:hypothetical protein